VKKNRMDSTSSPLRNAANIVWRQDILERAIMTCCPTKALYDLPPADSSRRPLTVAYWWLMLGGMGSVSESSLSSMVAGPDTTEQSNAAPALALPVERGLEYGEGEKSAAAAAEVRELLRKELLLSTIDKRRWRGGDGKIRTA
jgi:hypothetical protein